LARNGKSYSGFAPDNDGAFSCEIFHSVDPIKSLRATMNKRGAMTNPRNQNRIGDPSKLKDTCAVKNPVRVMGIARLVMWYKSKAGFIDIRSTRAVGRRCDT
jgi:hypothetical protein